MKKWIAAVLSALLVSLFAAETAAKDFSDDVTAPCGYSEEALAAGLKKNLVPLAADFLAAEEKYGVNAVFLAGVAALESGWGRHCFKPNNFFGWGKKSFETPAEGIDFVAGKLAEQYLSPFGKHYHGVSVAAVNRSYNGSDVWKRKVKSLMRLISDRAEDYQAENEPVLEPVPTPVGEGPIILGTW